MRTPTHSRIGLLAILAFAVSCGPQVKTVSVQPEMKTLTGINASVKLALTVKDEEGGLVSPQQVTWASNAPNVAKVDKGTVTAIGPGDATITATVGKIVGKAQVSVVVPSSLEVEPAGWQGIVGQDTSLSAHVKDNKGSTISDLQVDWAVDNEKVARVSSDGRVSAAGPGEATVTATYQKLSGTSKIMVKSAAPPVAKVKVKPANHTLKKKGDKIQLSATAMNAKGKPITGVAVTWTSSAPKVASVSPSGLVVAVGKGKASIVAQAGDKSDQAKIVVKK